MKVVSYLFHMLLKIHSLKLLWLCDNGWNRVDVISFLYTMKLKLT